jgi:hypothetical protein
VFSVALLLALLLIHYDMSLVERASVFGNWIGNHVESLRTAYLK